MKSQRCSLSITSLLTQAPKKMVWLISFIPTESTEMLIIFSQKHFLFVFSVDFTLWDRETIKRYSTRQNQASTTYEITTSDSIETKSSLLDVDTYSKTS